MPSITQLQYLVAVDQYRHFGRASTSVHISQPTLSMQIQKLEEEIGYPIFDRRKKPIVPTDKGQRFLHQARILLHEHVKLMDLAKQQQGEVSGDFHLGVIPTLAPYLLPLFMEHFARLYPKIQLTIDELKTDTILQQLREDQLDAGLLASPLHEAGLHEDPLFYEPFFLFVAENHPLSAQKKIKVDDLDSGEMWLLADGHCLRQQIVRYCSRQNERGAFKNIHFAGGNLDTLRQLIRTSRGYTLVPALMVDSLPEEERRIYVRELQSPQPSREISLVYRRDQWKRDILTAFGSSLREKIPERYLKRDVKKIAVVPVE